MWWGWSRSPAAGRQTGLERTVTTVPAMIVVSPDEGILRELDWLDQSEDSEVVEPVGLLVERMDVIPADEDC